MAKLVIDSLVVEGMADDQLDILFARLRAAIEGSGDWFYLGTGVSRHNVVWVSSASTIRLEYDQQPKAFEDREFYKQG